MTLSLKEDVSICFFSNRNVSCKKNYISCYVFKVALINDHNFTKDD